MYSKMIDLSVMIYLHIDSLYPAMIVELICSAMVFEWIAEFDFHSLEVTEAISAMQEDVGYFADIHCILHTVCLEDR